jgi:hypothetical protein
MGSATQAFDWIKKGAYQGPFEVRSKHGSHYIVDNQGEYVSPTGLSMDPLAFGSKAAAEAFVEKAARVDPSDEAASIINTGDAYAMELCKSLREEWSRLKRELAGHQRSGIGNTAAKDLLKVLLTEVKGFNKEFNDLEREIEKTLKR